MSMIKGFDKLIKDFYTIKDIAEQLQVKEKAVRRLVTRGSLKARKVCGKWVVTADNLKAFLDPDTSAPCSSEVS